LSRYADGAYGLCKSCGGPIDPARLRALPHATRCLNCQRRVEH
jgi:DnaK suppressor protein